MESLVLAVSQDHLVLVVPLVLLVLQVQLVRQGHPELDSLEVQDHKGHRALRGQ